MTVSSQVRKAGPYSGTGSTGPFTFSFKVFQASDVLVVKVNNTTSIETTLALTTDYTVSLNADQNANPGGTITLVAPLAVGYNMVISSQVPYLQETDLTNQGGFYPEVITDSLDKLTIEVQQIKLDTDRSAKLPITSTQSTDDLVADLVRLADSADNIDTVANNIGDVNDVATNMADVNTVADYMADVNNFASVYQGAKSSDPSLRNNGDPLEPGDLYFNTTVNEMRVYTATGWKSSTNYSATINRFSGTGSETAFTLSIEPLSENNTQVYISGVYQQKNAYSVSATTLTFVTAPPAGTDNIEVVVFSPLISGVTVAADDVQYTPAGTGAVATDVQAKLREIVSVKDFGAVGDGVADDTNAIKNAIASNRTVHFPAGTYLITSHIVKSNLSNVALIGEGRGVSTILCSASATFTNSPIGFSTCDTVEVSGLTIDQNNNSSLTAAYPVFIAVSSTRMAVRNCFFTRYTYIACALNSCTFSFIEDNIIERDTAINTTNYAINVSSSVSRSQGIVVRNNICRRASSIYSGYNIQVIGNTFISYKYGAGINTSQEADDGSYGQYIIIGNNCSNGTGVDSDGVNVAGMEILGQNNIISGNVCSQNGGVGIAVLGYRNIVSNNICSGNGVNLSASPAYRAGILMGYASLYTSGSYSFVSGNKCHDLGATTQLYGYYEESASLTGITCKGNDFTQNMTAPMYVQNYTTGSYETQGWLGYTPTMTASTGTITTVGTCSGRYKVIDKTVFFEISCAITTNGTAGGYIKITLPITASATTNARFSGREHGVTGKMLLGYNSGASECRVTFYDGTYPGANGAVITLSGSYESL